MFETLFRFNFRLRLLNISLWQHFFDALAGAVRSFFGVGSDQARRKDLEQVSPWMMIAAGIFLLLLFLISIFLLVGQVVAK